MALVPRGRLDHGTGIAGSQPDGRRRIALPSRADTAAGIARLLLLDAAWARTGRGILTFFASGPQVG